VRLFRFAPLLRAGFCKDCPFNCVTHKAKKIPNPKLQGYGFGGR
jgi:hypothetical protein